MPGSLGHIEQINDEREPPTSVWCDADRARLAVHVVDRQGDRCDVPHGLLRLRGSDEHIHSLAGISAGGCWPSQERHDLARGDNAPESQRKDQ